MAKLGNVVTHSCTYQADREREREETYTPLAQSVFLPAHWGQCLYQISASPERNKLYRSYKYL